ncbi:bifunctional 4-hydroxy-2-oxoglutarate aldolase/2-dehydro-3-deoxy-phosphogluconate aldolase [Compostibacter hankyongensis]|uniref:Bifunctional 4-hydroxy-2-oxoglutarate aldolase/2-dehydro-3-deoxy-phosphogluconate aldolase n=1 Tax=Compostibacter hankyongensis TaxID=1007089 RepID=A0ABP8G150_9BACT
MSDRIFSQEAFERMPVIGIMRNFAPAVTAAVVPLFEKAGFTTLEITMNSAGAEDIIRDLVARYPGLNIGAGTVCEMTDLERALAAGASFIVTPIVNEEIILHCAADHIPVFPGALTPTEVYRAWKLGASAVKVFPSAQYGAAYIRDLKAPLQQVPLLPTGGVSLKNIADFFAAGAMGAGMGSTLFDKTLIAAGDFEALYHHFEQLAATVKACLSRQA